MREYYAPLLKQFGLRNDEYRGSRGGLVECQNGRAGDKYIEGYSPNIQAFSTIYTGASAYDTSPDWPFPQLFWTDRGFILGDRSGLYTLAYAAGKWSVTALVARVASADINWPYTLANAAMFPVIASGDLLFYYDYNDGVPRDIGFNISDAGAEPGDKWNAAWRQPIAACYNHGQLFLGGATTYSGTPSHSRLVRWSQIGSMDFMGHTASASNNTAGFWYVETNDDDMVMAILPFGKSTIVYSQFGVFELIPAASPIPTFGINQLASVGINNPLAVAASKNRHIFVNRAGDLCQIVKEKEYYTTLEHQVLGFSEFLRDMNSDTIIATGTNLVSVTYEPVEDEFYISDGKSGFVLSNYGLTNCAKTVSGLVSFEEANSLVAANLGTSTTGAIGFTQDSGDKHLLIVTEPTDLGVPAVKLVQTVNVLASLPDGASMEVAIDWRMAKNRPFRRSQWVRANPQGVATPIVAALEFRVCVRILPFAGARVYDISAGWKSVDKRNIRGTYDASKAGSGSGS